ncbi:hypothetical protein ACFL20_08675 [Spirochaetota bacterium]
MRLRLIVLSLLICLPISVFGQSKNTTVVDTPTAFTLGRGFYQVSLLGYDNGGVEFKTFIGLHDNLFFGISFDMQGAIGKEKPQPNIPGVVARLKFTDGWESFPISIAIGYDSFYLGGEGEVNNTYNELNRMIYGPYFVITKPIYLFESEQYISFGMRLPAQPYFVPRDTSYFLSFDIPLGEFFRVKFEIERLYWNLQRAEQTLFNFGLVYSYQNTLAIEVDLMLHQNEKLNRMIKLIYTNEF